jgi:hypothetical protein
VLKLKIDQMKNTLSILSLTLLLFLSVSAVKAQEALKQKPSPLGMVTYKFDDAYVKVTYGRPHLRGREAFTADAPLAPTGKIWRTGANEATEITLTKDVLMAGNKVEAGTYTVFTIPGEEQWTIILNKDLGQWGAYKYDEKKDYLRFEVPVMEAKETYEPFTIMFDQSNGEVKMQFIWSDTLVEVPINFIN